MKNRLSILICITFILFNELPVKADSTSSTEAKLVARYEEAESKSRTDGATKFPIPDELLKQQNSATPTPTAEAKTSDQIIDRLLKEVEGLKTKVVVASRVELATQKPRTARNIGSRTVYNFKDGDVYEVRAGVDKVSDIELQLSEQLTNAPVAGDTVRWKIGVIKTGVGKKEITHIVLKPLETDIETNILITTNLRTYHLKAVAGDWYMPSISWNYPQEESPDLSDSLSKHNQDEPLSLVPEQLNFNYTIRGDDYAWKPLRIFDDGEHTFFQMPKSLRTSEAPALFVIDDDDPILVNYRVKGDYYIVDRLIDEAELRIGTKKKVQVCREEYCRSFFERLF